MLEAKVEGGYNLFVALENYDKDLSINLKNQFVEYLKPVVNKARSYIPTRAPLSGWGKGAKSPDTNYRPFPSFNYFEAKRGIDFRSGNVIPDSKGFVYGAIIYNASASGAIYEVAGRKNPQGRFPAQDIYRKQYANPYGVNPRNPQSIKGTRDYKSNNPFASYQFINALPPIPPAAKSGRRGRPSNKMRGRAIFRAYAETNGQVRAKVIKAMELTETEFRKRMQKRYAA